MKGAAVVQDQSMLTKVQIRFLNYSKKPSNLIILQTQMVSVNVRFDEDSEFATKHGLNPGEVNHKHKERFFFSNGNFFQHNRDHLCFHSPPPCPHFFIKLLTSFLDSLFSTFS
jgi:hypothetical protein